MRDDRRPEIMVERSTAPATREVPPRRGLGSRGWNLYLVAMAGLVPIVLPAGPGQTAIADALNAVALPLLIGALLVHRMAISLPFAPSVAIVAGGSLLAFTGALSPSAGLLTVLQDVYLYSWFVLLVALMSRRGDLRGLRLAWACAADAIALLAIVQSLGRGGSLSDLLLGSRLRAAATFYNPNMLADYLMLSVFVLLGLGREVRRWFFAPSLGLLLLALLSTKSNGGMISLGVGLAVWAAARSLARGLAPVRLGGALCLAVGLASIAGLALAQWSPGRVLRPLEQRSFVGRISHSSASREEIWRQLGHTYARSPLGIGPGNSAAQTVAIGERERPGSMRSKEAHSDYLAFAIERGPLGLVGLLLWIGQGFAMVSGARRRLGLRAGGSEKGDGLWAAFLGGLAGTAVHSTVIEKLHFRHYWLFLAIACAMAGESRANEEAAPAYGDAERTQTGRGTVVRNP